MFLVVSVASGGGYPVKISIFMKIKTKGLIPKVH